jgi:hypothetical protein
MSKYIDRSEVQANNLDKVIVAEVYKPVVGFEQYYMVSNYGNVISLHGYGDTVYLSRQIGRHGYYTVCLSIGGYCKPYLLHRLVAQAFIPNPNGYACINHKDETHDNNNVDDLEWCDKEYNNNYGTLAERKRVIMLNHPKTSKPVWCKENNITYASAREAARNLGVCPSNIINCCNGKQHTCKGLHFMYGDKY